MATKKKVVCPKCKAKLKFDPDKVICEVAKFKCPGCASVLCIRKSSLQKENSSSLSTSQVEQKVGMNMEVQGAELTDLAGDDQAGEAEGIGSVVEPHEEKQEKHGEEKENKEEFFEKTKENEIKGRNSRDFKRVKFKKKVLVNNQIMVEALDISENGLFLHTGRSFEDGTIVNVGIPTQPGSFDLTVQAMVKHNHRGIGMGLQFVDLDDKKKIRLNKLISELAEAASKELEGRKKILLVGGTDTARNINKSKLVLDGFYVLQATTADEIFHILNNETPDAMVLEWQETKFNCKGVLARIKENSQYAAIIRVVLSALTDSSVQREILQAGAHRCMAKMDTNPVRLSLALKQLIAERDN
jgi:CheY-like chemotaxis protein